MPIGTAVRSRARVDLAAHGKVLRSPTTSGASVPSRKILKSVLHNFLGTFASRYSDHRGYWLFGQVPADVEHWAVDLRADAPAGDAVVEVCKRLAIRRFAEQLSKAGFEVTAVAAASLSWSRGEPARGWQGEHEVDGHRVELRVRMVTDTGRVIERVHSCFVAAHDPRRERRRLPVDWDVWNWPRGSR